MKTFDNVTVINFCDENFQQTRSLCSKSAIEKGKATRVIEYSPKMIDEIFKRQNHDILSQTRGAGLWIWKPYFIKKTLEEMREGEYLFYTDAGVIFIKPIQYILDFIKTFNQDIIPFELPLLESEWSKKETAYAVADLTIIADNFNDADCETFNNHGYYVCNSQTVNTQTLMSTERKHGKSYVRSWDCVKQEYGKVWSGRGG